MVAYMSVRLKRERIHSLGRTSGEASWASGRDGGDGLHEILSEGRMTLRRSGLKYSRQEDN